MGLARVPRKCRLRVAGHSSHVSPRSYAERERPAASAVPSTVRKTTTASVARRASAASLRVLPTPERQPTKYRESACHAKAGCVLKATARTSHHGLTPKERGLPLVQCHYIVRSTTILSAVRRARVASSRKSLPPETQPAQWGLRACHANAGCALEAKARTSHHGLALKERGLPPLQYRLRCAS